ncbi:unnamed protein product, partial [Rotaria magnacalcarata]
SYSFELRRNNFLLPSIDNTSPDISYPTSYQMNRERINLDKSLRSTSINVLVNSGAMLGSQNSLSTRKVIGQRETVHPLD